jgi:hypothetical protein
MECIDKVTPKGFLKIQVFDAKTGKELRKLRVEKPNLITQGSKRALTRLLSQEGFVFNPVTAGTYNPMEYRLWGLYVGDDNTAPATTQVALQALVNITRKQLTQPLTITTEYSGIVEVEATLTDTDHNNKYLRECGLFSRGDNDDPDSASNASMFARQVHGEIYKTAAITVKYTWRYQITT